jgi:hypothetical protein
MIAEMCWHVREGFSCTAMESITVTVHFYLEFGRPFRVIYLRRTRLTHSAASSPLGFPAGISLWRNSFLCVWTILYLVKTCVVCYSSQGDYLFFFLFLFRLPFELLLLRDQHPRRAIQIDDITFHIAYHNFFIKKWVCSCRLNADPHIFRDIWDRDVGYLRLEVKSKLRKQCF